MIMKGNDCYWSGDDACSGSPSSSSRRLCPCVEGSLPPAPHLWLSPSDGSGPGSYYEDAGISPAATLHVAFAVVVLMVIAGLAYVAWSDRQGRRPENSAPLLGPQAAPALTRATATLQQPGAPGERENGEGADISTYIDGLPDWVVQMWIAYVAHTVISYFVFAPLVQGYVRPCVLYACDFVLNSFLVANFRRFFISYDDTWPLSQVENARYRISSERYYACPSGLVLACDGHCGYDEYYDDCICTCESESVSFGQCLTAISPFVHVLVLPFFMWKKRQHALGLQVASSAIPNSRASPVMLQQRGESVVFAIRYNCCQTIFIGTVGRLIQLVEFLINLLKLVRIDCSSFFFPLPFYQFWKAQLQVENYRISGARICLNALQADAYFLFLKEALLNLYTLGFYRSCPCRFGPCRNRTRYEEWLDKHVEWNGSPPPGTSNEFVIFDDRLRCTQKCQLMCFQCLCGCIPCFQTCSDTYSYRLRLENLTFGGVKPQFGNDFSCSAMYCKYVSTLCWLCGCCKVWRDQWVDEQIVVMPVGVISPPTPGMQLHGVQQPQLQQQPPLRMSLDTGFMVTQSSQQQYCPRCPRCSEMESTCGICLAAQQPQPQQPQQQPQPPPQQQQHQQQRQKPNPSLTLLSMLLPGPSENLNSTVSGPPQQQQQFEQRRRRLQAQRQLRRSNRCCINCDDVEQPFIGVDGELRAWLGFSALGLFVGFIMCFVVLLVLVLLYHDPRCNLDSNDGYGQSTCHIQAQTRANFLAIFQIVLLVSCGCAPSVWVCCSPREPLEPEDGQIGSFARITWGGELMILAPLADDWCCSGEGSCIEIISNRQAGRDDIEKFFARRNNNCFWCSWCWSTVVAVVPAGVMFLRMIDYYTHEYTVHAEFDSGNDGPIYALASLLLACMPTCCLWVGRGGNSGMLQCIYTDYRDVMTPLATEAAVAPSNAAERSPQSQLQPQPLPSRLAEFSQPASPAAVAAAATQLLPSQLSLAEFYTAHKLESFASALEQLGVCCKQPAHQSHDGIDCQNNCGLNYAWEWITCSRMTRKT